MVDEVNSKKFFTFLQPSSVVLIFFPIKLLFFGLTLIYGFHFHSI